jgi:hypothetical protein
MNRPATPRPLGIRPDVSLSTEQVEMLRALETYDLWFVEERLSRKNLVPPERIAGAVFEFKRYMALVGLGYRGLGMLSRDVDEVWHGLILFTREYDDFCRTAFGTFIHHVPRTSRTPESDHGSETFLAAYQDVFGEIPVEWYGVKTEQADGRTNEPSGCGTEDCTDG